MVFYTPLIQLQVKLYLIFPKTSILVSALTFNSFWSLNLATICYNMNHYHRLNISKIILQKSHRFAQK